MVGLDAYYFSASGCEQIIMNNQQLLEQLYEGDVLMLTSFLDVGSASFDMWPSIFLIYDRGVVIQTLDDGFVSSMPDGNMVMEAIRRSIKSQRNYFINNYVLEPIN